MSRPAQPDDIYRLNVPLDPQLSPDGELVAFTVRRSAAGRDGYRHSVWLAPADGSADARQVTIGARSDSSPRFSPDGRTLAFISDRRVLVEEEPDRPSDRKDRSDAAQVHLLPLQGGEARRLTDLPQGVNAYAWSPDGRTLAVLTTSLGATIEADKRKRNRPDDPKPGTPPLSDFRYLDALAYQYNGAGFIDDQDTHLWLVDVATGEARPLVVGPTAESSPAWSPDGTRIAFSANRGADPDLHWRSGLFVVVAATGKVTAVAGGNDGAFENPGWTRDGSTVLAYGGRMPKAAYRTGIWAFAADGSDAGARGGRDLLAGTDLMPYSGMNSDITVGSDPQITVTGDGKRILFTAPVDGSYELWSLPVKGGTPERLTHDRHYLAGWTAVPSGKGHKDLVAAVRSAPTELPEIVTFKVDDEGAGRKVHRITHLNDALAAEIAWVMPLERRWTSEGYAIQGWLYPGGEGMRPTVLQIHGGPHTLYGWSPILEWQILAGAGISVLACNPRGSEGYGEAFNRANLGDWGDGPMADVLAGVDQAVADGMADPDRLGVTGGSYGGYLTNWIIGKTDRFKAAFTARSVVDMRTLFLTGDISSSEWCRTEFGRLPWEDADYFYSISPISLADTMRTPLLIQHAEQDLRCTIGQAEMLFTVLRSKRRQVRFMRVPGESHELTRSGKPFRRVENLVAVHDWFAHYLLKGGTKLPPKPRNRAGK